MKKLFYSSVLSRRNKNTMPKLVSGFTLLIAIITTSMLLIVSFVVINVALKQLILANASKESQHAFYAADGGTECAVYWDLIDSALSRFATTTAGSVICNGQTVSTNSQTVPTLPVGTMSLVGGGGNSNPTSIFKIDFTKGCAIIRVTKSYTGSVLLTTIDSRGYNTCDTNAARRYERGVIMSY